VLTLGQQRCGRHVYVVGRRRLFTLQLPLLRHLDVLLSWVLPPNVYLVLLGGLALRSVEQDRRCLDANAVVLAAERLPCGPALLYLRQREGDGDRSLILLRDRPPPSGWKLLRKRATKNAS
jgi:hypothetical protein